MNMSYCDICGKRFVSTVGRDLLRSGYTPAGESCDDCRDRISKLLYGEKKNDTFYEDCGEYRIFKWPGGNHYYAKVGNVDVVWEGRQKWNIESGAKRAAVNFLKHNSRRR
jgi:hypothetical protein